MANVTLPYIRYMWYSGVEVQHMAKIGGVYKLWLSDTHYYGGRAKYIVGRVCAHRSQLSRGIHANPYLQRVWNKHRILRHEVVSIHGTEDEQIEAEQKWLDENIGKPGCMNMNTEAFGSPWGVKRTPEVRRKISAAKMGHSVSESTRQKLSAIFKGRVVTEEAASAISAGLQARKAAGLPMGGFKKGGVGLRKGIPQSEERKAAQSIRMKQWWDERKNGGSTCP